MSKSAFVCRIIPERVVVGLFHPEGWRVDELTLDQAKLAAANLQDCIDRLERDTSAQNSWSDFMATLPRNPKHGRKPD
jgi:hypothetical protein